MERTTVVDATLTLEPDTEVLVAPGGYLHVTGSGALVAIGTEDAPIVFTSEAADPLAGDWECISLEAQASASELSHVRLEYGGATCSTNGAGNRATLQVFTGARNLSNLTITDSASSALLFAGDVRGFSNNTFARNAEPSILLRAPNLIALTGPHTFEDADDFILVETGSRLSTSGTWNAQGVPYRLDGTLEVRLGADVTVEAGTTIQLQGSIDVFEGSFNTMGTAEAPVLLTSAHDSPIAGDWGCVFGDAGRFSHTTFEYGGAGCGGMDSKSLLLANDQTMIDNCTFRESAGSAIHGYFASDAVCPSWCDTNTFEAIATTAIDCGSTTPSPVACP